jgi:CBS domain-containing protein
MLKLRGHIDTDADIMKALKLMHRNRVTVLPVYEGDKVVGVLRDSDLFLAAANILAN